MSQREPIGPDLRQGAYRSDTIPESAQAVGRHENKRVRDDRKQNGPVAQEHEDRRCSLAALGLAPL